MSIIDTNNDSENEDTNNFIGKVEESFVVGFNISLDQIIESLRMGETTIHKVIDAYGPSVGNRLRKLIQQSQTPKGRY